MIKMIISVQDLALSNTYQLEALIHILERKGILTSEEVLDELEVIAATKEGRRLIEDDVEE